MGVLAPVVLKESLQRVYEVRMIPKVHFLSNLSLL